jgi:hypothetical protein
MSFEFVRFAFCYTEVTIFGRINSARAELTLGVHAPLLPLAAGTGAPDEGYVYNAKVVGGGGGGPPPPPPHNRSLRAPPPASRHLT